VQKLKIIFTAEVEYTPNPKFYATENEPVPSMKDMLRIDLAHAEDDPLSFIDGDNVKWSIIGKIEE